jgi:hypothetical protein
MILKAISILVVLPVRWRILAPKALTKTNELKLKMI